MANRSESDVANMMTQPGHHWLLDTFVNGHQIGHWAESLAFFHAIHLQESSYGLRPLRRLLINKVDPPLSDHERFIFDVAMMALQYPVEPPLWYLPEAHAGGVLALAKVSRPAGSRTLTGDAAASGPGREPACMQAVPGERCQERSLLRRAVDVLHHCRGRDRPSDRFTRPAGVQARLLADRTSTPPRSRRRMPGPRTDGDE